MEDPIRFDTWARITAGQREVLIQFLQNSFPDRPAVELRKRANDAVRGAAILIAQHVTWARVSRMLSRDLELFSEISVYQEGYGPSDCSHRRSCPIHNVFYSGVLGCPVCGEFYAK
ncbi:MAG TPA: hypothetical protein VEC99_17980 [Clostridia bacterium]|nr:hypothetical protein [Clostridia bacterium]